LTDGKSYDVPHRDFVLISRAVIDLGVTDDPATRIYDRIVRISPLHIVRIENLQLLSSVSQVAGRVLPLPSATQRCVVIGSSVSG